MSDDRPASADEPTKVNQVSHILLDAAYALAESVTSDLPLGSIDLALQRINTLDAIPVTVEGDPQSMRVEVDPSILVSGAYVVIEYLLQENSRLGGSPIEDAVADARHYVDAFLEYQLSDH